MDLHTSSEASVRAGADLAVLGAVGAILGDAGGVRRRDGDRLARGIALHRCVALAQQREVVGEVVLEPLELPLLELKLLREEHLS